MKIRKVEIGAPGRAVQEVAIATDDSCIVIGGAVGRDQVGVGNRIEEVTLMHRHRGMVSAKVPSKHHKTEIFCAPQ